MYRQNPLNHSVHMVNKGRTTTVSMMAKLKDREDDFDIDELDTSPEEMADQMREYMDEAEEM